MKDGISLGEKQTRNKNVLLRVFKRTEHFRSCLPTPKNDNFRIMLCTNSQTLNIQSTEPSHNSVSPNFLRTRFSNGVLNRTSNRLFYHLLWKGKLKGGGLAMNKERKVKEVLSECDYFQGRNPAKDNDTSAQWQWQSLPQWGSERWWSLPLVWVWILRVGTEKAHPTFFPCPRYEDWSPTESDPTEFS